ncbi:malate dehydrogenase [Glaciihabitans sp. dw_435]|uniref:malate dehydrogenase n=1 Tax=Glaciihabitans sp. dw_435 TaxID=2720081 RepID=UPI001BD5A58D|nr:malate dehydrogenase [Glaciihabitans sp. dw_435]
MTSVPVVTISGASGQIAYDIAFAVAAGALLGRRTPLRLRLLSTPRSTSRVEGLALELEDTIFPMLHSVDVFDDATAAFDGTDIAFLVASGKLTPGTNRLGFLESAVPIAAEHGAALNAGAADDIRAVVVSNPVNTTVGLMSAAARDIPRSRFSGLSRLDHNRAVAAFSRHYRVPTEDVTRMAVWGNHSDTQYADASNVRVAGTPVVHDAAWTDEAFATEVARRGHVVRDLRGPSVASAALSAVGHMRDWVGGTPADDWASAAVFSDGSYGIPEGLVSSFPVTSTGGDWEIVQGLSLTDEATTQIGLSVDELQHEWKLAGGIGR